MNSHRVKAYIFLIIVSIIWGMAGPIIKYTLGGISPILFLGYRFFISAIIAFVILSFRRTKILQSNNLALVLVYGVLSTTISLGLLFLGLDKTTVLDMSFITLLGPIIIAVSGVILFHEHVTKREKIGITITLIGTLVTIIQPIFENGLNSGQLLGNILVFIYLIANTATVIVAKKLLKKGVNSLDLTLISFIIGFISALPFVLLSSNFSLKGIYLLDFKYHLGVLFMAVLSGNLAYFLWIKAQKTIEIGEAALFNYLYPVIAAPLAVFWLGEKVTTVFILGALIIITGVILAEYKKSKKPRVSI